MSIRAWGLDPFSRSKMEGAVTETTSLLTNAAVRSQRPSGVRQCALLYWPVWQKKPVPTDMANVLKA